MNASRAGVTREPVHICEVGPRDGLQNETKALSVDDKVAFINALTASGFPEIEVGSFVSPKAIPQLADTAEVFSRIERRPGVIYSALVPNERGFERAVESKVDKVCVFTAATDAFTQHNVGASIEETLERFKPVIVASRRQQIPVRAYISCVVTCPYSGRVRPDEVKRVALRLLEIGVTELDLGDTIGVASPADIDRLLEALDGVWAPSEVTFHLHDTRGSALACVLRALQLGVRSFDASCGGLGGCPYAPGSSGNLASEDLVYLCDGLGLSTGIAVDDVAEAARSICKVLSIAPRSKFASACGPQSPAS